MFEDSYLDTYWEDRYEMADYGGHDGTEFDGVSAYTCPACGSAVYEVDDFSGEGFCTNEECGASLWWDDDTQDWREF